MIALVVLTLLGWHASRIAAGLNEWPASWSFLSNARLAARRPRRAASRERVFVWAHVCVIARVPLLPAVLEAPAHRDRRGQRVLLAHARARAARAALASTCPTTSCGFGVGTIGDLTWKEMVDAFSCTECGRCQDVCPAYATGKLLSPKLLIMGIRDQLFAEGPNLLAGGELPPIVGNGVPGGDDLGLRHLRRVRPRVPGVDRARRPHRRPAPRARDDAVELPVRGGVDAARRRAHGQPVGEAAGRPRVVGRGARRARRRGRRAGAGDPLLGRLRRGLRRARAHRRRVDGEAAAAAQASTSRSSARASRAPATRRGAWATSTSSSRTPSRTSRR